MQEFEPPLDKAIAPIVHLLRSHDITTLESCQGGKGHAFPEPTVVFSGQRPDGFRALAVVQQHGYTVLDLRRVWSIEEGEPTGPYWEMTFKLA